MFPPDNHPSMFGATSWPCLHCGAQVWDKGQHRIWHGQVDVAIGSALSAVPQRYVTAQWVDREPEPGEIPQEAEPVRVHVPARVQMFQPGDKIPIFVPTDLDPDVGSIE